MILENIENLNNGLEELQNHPCCFNFEFDDYERLTVIFPEGYFYKNTNGIRLNESSRIKNIKHALEILEIVWKESLEPFNLIVDKK